MPSEQKNCPHCGASLPGQAAFCPHCAQSVRARKTVVPPVRLWRKALRPVLILVVLLAAAAGLYARFSPNHYDAYGASHYPGAALISPTTLTFDADDYGEVLRFFYFVI